MQVPFTKVTLDNGLDVIVHEDHQVPLAAVSVWYHVGSKNERPGLTGLAHLFEHLMFEGSAHQPHGYFPPLQEAGASLNGSTSTDRTNYWELVPRDALRLALWMEADRMGWLLPALTDARFETQRGVVLNERRQNYENRPYGLAQFALMQAMYPADHPYHWPTIGFPEDLAQATADDCRAFFARYYHPGNASVAVAGDVDTAEVLAMVERVVRTDPDRRAGGPRGHGASPTGARSARARRPRRTGAPVPGLAVARALHGRRRRTGSGGGSHRQRPDVATLSPTDSRAAGRHRTGGRTILARRRRHVPDHRLGGAGTIARRTGDRDPRGDRRVRHRRAQRRRRRRADAPRPKPRSCTGCRRSADSAARPIS